MARQVLAILSAVHSAGKAHGAVCPGAVEVGTSDISERVRLRVLPASLLLREMAAFGSDPMLPYLAPELVDQGLRRVADSSHHSGSSSSAMSASSAASSVGLSSSAPSASMSPYGSSLVSSAAASSADGSGGEREMHAAAAAADIFAFGVLLHWMHLPESPPPIAGNLNLPPLLDSSFGCPK